ncbi:hypothetical protein JDW15_09935 [Aerococcaceae bacterium zg-ZJ1578]|uniref:hypothetical protein n=1 Tax=Aerococcaceae bacterium zg-252 TaxID=2796928 RepID=UPI001A255D25|nr:hypothetical protein [Aerococcaceae bacterium zg-1578]
MNKFEMMERIQTELNLESFHAFTLNEECSEEEYLKIKEIIQNVLNKQKAEDEQIPNFRGNISA